MSPARPSWRPLIAATVVLFLVIFAFLAGRLRAGGDPSVGTRSTPVTQQTTNQAPPQLPEDHDAGMPQDMTPSAGPPTTHQS